ncbi:hypothetical protein [Pontibacter actiniarum]|uniref:hypothetical protein n=1 Tax=Pontibacter actiniarum TaxID=323450 RepID=UPI0012F9B86C|nr:hypothetical protein [Pontibacter actiniarum]
MSQELCREKNVFERPLGWLKEMRRFPVDPVSSLIAFWLSCDWPLYDSVFNLFLQTQLGFLVANRSAAFLGSCLLFLLIFFSCTAGAALMRFCLSDLFLSNFSAAFCFSICRFSVLSLWLSSATIRAFLLLSCMEIFIPFFYPLLFCSWFSTSISALIG